MLFQVQKFAKQLIYLLHDLEKIINHIRITNQLPALCSASNGYFVATNIYEMQDYIISLKQRIKAQGDVLNALEQQTILFGGTGQTTLFE